jgi:DNA helicase-2/ATP-dependent DNA helicase PcrA
MFSASCASHSFLDDLNDDQLAAVTSSFDTPLFIYAGAGSGKTRTLICRITYMINQGISPETILAITFTRKAADEIRERLRQFVGPRAGDAVTCTFHQLCLTILKEHPFIMNFSKGGFRVADPAIQRKIVKKACTQLLTRPRDRGPHVLRILTSRMLNFVRRSKTMNRTSADFEGECAFVLKFYEDELRRHRLIDFSDFLTFTERLLKEYPRVAYEYGRCHQYVLIDEFQDTCALNFSIIRLIIGRNSQRITIVGDIRQSIYGFRGANPGNVAQFFSDFPAAVRVNLSRNYRNTQTILAAAQSLIGPDTDYATPLVSLQSRGELVKVIVARDSLEEVESICEQIERLVYPGSQFQYRDIVVMFRVRRISSDIEMELFRHNIPYTHKRGVGFFLRRDVREVIAYARLALSYEDDGGDPNQLIANAVETVINVPDRGIGQNTIKDLKERAGSTSLLRYMVKLPEGDFGKVVRGRIRKFTQLIHQMHAQLCVVNDRLGTDTALQLVIEMSGMIDDEPGDDDHADVDGLDEVNDAILDYMNDRRETLELLIEEAKRFHRTLMQIGGEPTTPVCLAKFINAITLEGKGEMTKNAVTLSTVHQMKGLEARVCFLMRFNEGVLPVSDAVVEESGAPGIDATPTLEEERRITYVAMTRAKERLFISMCLSCRGRAMEPSRFLGEIDGRCLTKQMLSADEKKQASALMDYADDDFYDLEPVYKSKA